MEQPGIKAVAKNMTLNFTNFTVNKGIFHRD